jgi:tRNA-dihydrouridine synthase A
MDAAADLAGNPWRLSVAPMMDWTDRHCRYFHRLIARHTRLYTEMVTTGALLHGDVPRQLDFNVAEHPLALQLGGSEPEDLAACARLAERWGYDEVNLNCGCPSERVQRGAFGACLMNEPRLVAACVRAMGEATRLPVTVKHRIGIGRTEASPQAYAFVRDFVGTVAEAGCRVFIVHARNAWLEGLSPKENRHVPPLRHELVHALKRDFPDLTIVVNGGLGSPESIDEQLRSVDGVMVGRLAYHEPWTMARWDSRFLGAPDDPAGSRLEVERAMVAYLETVRRGGQPWAIAARHMLGLWNGTPGARRWRQVWSDHGRRDDPPQRVFDAATRAREQAAGASAVPSG